MKNVWISFCCVLFFAATFFSFFKNPELNAQERGPASARGTETEVPGSSEMRAALDRKQEKLELQTREMSIQKDRLLEEEKRVTQKIEKLQSMLEKVKTYEAEHARLESEEFMKIVKTYEKMPPKKAAAVISVMEDKVALEILKQIKEKSMAGILAAMDSQRAMSLTSKLAERVPANLSEE